MSVGLMSAGLMSVVLITNKEMEFFTETSYMYFFQPIYMKLKVCAWWLLAQYQNYKKHALEYVLQYKDCMQEFSEFYLY